MFAQGDYRRRLLVSCFFGETEPTQTHRSRTPPCHCCCQRGTPTLAQKSISDSRCVHPMDIELPWRLADDHCRSDPSTRRAGQKVHQDFSTVPQAVRHEHCEACLIGTRFILFGHNQTRSPLQTRLERQATTSLSAQSSRGSGSIVKSGSSLSLPSVCRSRGYAEYI